MLGSITLVLQTENENSPSCIKWSYVTPATMVVKNDTHPCKCTRKHTYVVESHQIQTVREKVSQCHHSQILLQMQ